MYNTRKYSHYFLVTLQPKSLLSWPTPCNHMDCGPPGSSLHGVFQARILEWVAISSPTWSFWYRDQTHISYVSLTVSSVQSLNCVWVFVTPWIAACQASLSITNSWSVLKLMYVKSVMHITITSSVITFFCCLLSFPASGSFPVSQFFISGDQILGLQLQHQSFQWIFRTDFL